MRYLLRLRTSVNPAAAAVIPAMHALVAAKAALSPVAGSAFLPFVRFSVFTVVPFLPASAFALLLGLSVGAEVGVINGEGFLALAVGSTVYALAACVERGYIGGIFVKRLEAARKAMQVERRAQRQCDYFHTVLSRSQSVLELGRVSQKVTLGFGVPQSVVFFD